MSIVIRRTAALLALCSAVLHGVSLDATMNPWLAVLTVAMIVGCLYCAYELWSRDTVRGWVLVAVMNVTMVGLHLPMAGGHHHRQGLIGTPAAMASAMQWATVVAIVEVLLAAVVLFVRTRALAPAVVAPCQSGHHDYGGTTGRPAGRDLHRLSEPN